MRIIADGGRRQHRRARGDCIVAARGEEGALRARKAPVAVRYCEICEYNIKYLKHCESESHLRRVMCLLLLHQKDEIMGVPSAESLQEIHDVLVTQKKIANRKPLRPTGGVTGSTGINDVVLVTNTYLFGTTGKNWSEISKAGQNECRGTSQDFAKIWFLEFLKILKRRCEDLKTSTLDEARLNLVRKIARTIDALSLHTMKRRKTSPSAQVVNSIKLLAILFADLDIGRCNSLRGARPADGSAGAPAGHYRREGGRRVGPRGHRRGG